MYFFCAQIEYMKFITRLKNSFSSILSYFKKQKQSKQALRLLHVVLNNLMTEHFSKSFIPWGSVVHLSSLSSRDELQDELQVENNTETHSALIV